MPGRNSGLVQFGIIGRHETDIGQVAETLRIVHAVADHKVVGDLESDIVGVDLFQAARRLVEQRGDAQRSGLVLLKEAAQETQGEAGIEDVFDDDDVLAFDRLVEIFDEFSRRRLFAGLCRSSRQLRSRRCNRR